MRASTGALAALLLLSLTMTVGASQSCESQKQNAGEYGPSPYGGASLEKVDPAHKADLDAIASWIGKQVVASGRMSYSDEEIKKGTGLDVSPFSPNQVMTTVLEWMSTNEEGLDFLSKSCEHHSGEDEE